MRESRVGEAERAWLTQAIIPGTMISLQYMASNSRYLWVRSLFLLEDAFVFMEVPPSYIYARNPRCFFELSVQILLRIVQWSELPTVGGGTNCADEHSAGHNCTG